MIRDENGKLAITPGEWILGDENDGHAEIELAQTDCQINTSRMQRWGVGTGMTRREMLANIHLCIDAGTVANECGKTPRELLDLCRELHTSLAFFSKLVEGSMGLCGWHMHGGSVAWGDWQKELDAAKSALDKSEGV